MPHDALPLKAWREEVARAVFALDFKPLGDTPFHAETTPILATKSVQVLRWRHTPGYTFRDEALVRDGLSAYALVVPERPIEYAQRHGSGRLRAGEATLLNTAEPGSLGSPSPSCYVALIVPDAAEIGAGQVEPLLGQTWPRTLPALRLLRAYLSALADLPAAELAPLAARHVTDLVALAARQRLDLDTVEQAQSVEDQRVVVALDYISRNFRDPGLAEPAVAAAQGISTRYLQRLLERAGVRFTERVNAIRLEAAREAFVDQRLGHRRIAAIALDCGFSDISHFNRLFRRRFGATPSALRSHWRQSAG
ncbi:MAG: AraC family transcriptional regulator [Hyphomicrobiaceae bacterium]